MTVTKVKREINTMFRPHSYELFHHSSRFITLLSLLSLSLSFLSPSLRNLQTIHLNWTLQEAHKPSVPLLRPWHCSLKASAALWLTAALAMMKDREWADLGAFPTNWKRQTLKSTLFKRTLLHHLSFMWDKSASDYSQLFY